MNVLHWKHVMICDRSVYYSTWHMTSLLHRKFLTHVLSYSCHGNTWWQVVVKLDFIIFSVSHLFAHFRIALILGTTSKQAKKYFLCSMLAKLSKQMKLSVSVLAPIVHLFVYLFKMYFKRIFDWKMWSIFR